MECDNRIIDLLNEKAAVKQEVNTMGQKHFSSLKDVAGQLVDTLCADPCPIHKSVEVELKEKNEFEFQLFFGGDVLHFSRHSNVFKFEDNHRVWKLSYLKEDRRRGFFAVINIYNFMADSIKMQRLNDHGILLGRIFINREGHFFTEGSRQFSFLFNDLARQKCDASNLLKMMETAIIYGLEYDLTVPAYKDMLRASVKQVLSESMQREQYTSKKVGLGYYSRMKKI